MADTFYAQINPMAYASTWMERNSVASMRYDLSNARLSHGGQKTFEASAHGTR
tara:strand:+ start:1853 stop:2011 length:159 start_codon:yes stop_codon:yes gene_type:complete